jgi:hypothetical protein
LSNAFDSYDMWENKWYDHYNSQEIVFCRVGFKNEFSPSRENRILMPTYYKDWIVKHKVDEESISSHEIPNLIFKIVLLKIVFNLHNDTWSEWRNIKGLKSLIGLENCFQDGVKCWLHIMKIIKLRSMELNASYQ